MATSNLRFRIIGDDDASSAFLKVAAAARLTKSTFDDIGTSALGLTKMVGGAGLIPVLAGTAAVATELGTSLTAGALATGVFGLSVAGIGKDMVDAQKKITALDTKLGTLTKGTDDYRATLKELRDQQADFNKQFGPAATGLADLKTGFDQFKQSTSKVTTGVMGKAFELLAGVLPRLAPVANAAGRAVGGLIDELTDWTNGPGFNAVLKWLKDSGPKAITHFGHAIGNTVDALGGIFSNFVGPGDDAAKALDHLTKRFADWGHSKGVSDSVDKFLKYVSGNGDQISSVFRSLADVLPKLAVALGQLGALNLSAIAMFLNLIANLPQGAFNVVVTGLFGIVAAAKALAIVQGISALITGLAGATAALGEACLLARAQLVLLWATEKIGAAITGVMTGAQWLLNAAMTANPIGLVVLALVALGAGLVIAYKKSETFRNIVNGAFHGVQVGAAAVFGWVKDHWALLFAILGGPIGLVTVLIIKNFDRISAAIKVLGSWGKWLWNSVFQPVFKYIVVAVGAVLNVWADMLSALSHVPGFGWVGNIADALHGAADKASELANRIRDIPPTKSVSVIINVVKGVVHTSGGRVPLDAGAGGGGSGGGFDKMLVDPGIKLIEGLVEGIKRGYVPLTTALAKVTDYVMAQRDKLKGLISDRNQFASGFKSFSSSVFGADFGQDANGNAATPTTAGIIAFQRQQADQARTLRANVRKLVHLGLSPALLKQMAAAGPAGVAEIAELAAHASKQQIKQLNAANRATAGALHGAGMAAGNAIFGDQIVQTRNNEDLAKRIARELRRDADHGKGEYVVIKVDGNEIIKAVRKDKRTRGQGSNV